MTNRRQFLQVSIAAPALNLIHISSAAAGIPGTGRTAEAGEAGEVLGFYKAVYDQRHPQSVEFARHLDAQGFETHGMAGGDITPFWYRELDAVWQASPLPLVGMTTAGPLFCLEQLAAREGMRVVFRAQHHTNGALVKHSIEGPETLLQVCRQEGFAGTGHWPALMAELMLSCPTGATALDRMVLESPVAATTHNNNESGPLISWIIAPARRLAKASNEQQPAMSRSKQ